MNFDKDLDARGLNCPLPILRTKKALGELQSGQVLRVIATDPGSVKDFAAFCKQTGNELLSQADFVILQMPYAPETHHLIGAAELQKMKATAILINSTRGGIVDDAALVRALKDGTIRAAGLDTFEGEPNINPGFLELKNVVLAPHIGSSTEATRRAMAMTAAKNAVAAVTGGNPPNLLNPEARK